MYPACIATAALLVTKASSTGGLTALVAKKLHSKTSANRISTTLSELEFSRAIEVNELQFDQFAEGGTAQPFADATMELRQWHPSAVRAWGKKRPAGVRALCAAGAVALPTTPENYSSALW